MQPSAALIKRQAELENPATGVVVEHNMLGVYQGLDDRQQPVFHSVEEMAANGDLAPVYATPEAAAADMRAAGLPEDVIADCAPLQVENDSGIGASAGAVEQGQLNLESAGQMASSLVPLVFEASIVYEGVRDGMSDPRKKKTRRATPAAPPPMRRFGPGG